MNILQSITRTQRLFLVAIAVAAALLSYGIVYTMSGGNNVSANPAKCDNLCVALYEDKAAPNTLAVAKGSYVQFNSADGKTHSLSLGGGGDEHSHQGKFNSGEFKADEGWKVQFNEEGSFKFHDHLNPKINVLVVVYTPGKDYQVQ